MRRASDREVVREFPARTDQLGEIRRFVLGLAREDQVASRAYWIALAVTEACTNAILHSGSERLTVTWRAATDRIEVLVTDQGTFERRIRSPELDGTGHRGIPIMMASMDEVHLTEGRPGRPGTTVRLVLRRRADEDPAEAARAGAS